MQCLPVGTLGDERDTKLRQQVWQEPSAGPPPAQGPPTERVENPLADLSIAEGNTLNMHPLGAYKCAYS